MKFPKWLTRKTPTPPTELKVGDECKFRDEMLTYYGQVQKIFKNGKISVFVYADRKVHHIKKEYVHATTKK